MSIRSLGSKFLNNSKGFVNANSTVSQNVIPSHPNDKKQSEDVHMSKPLVRMLRSGRRKKRQRMHFRPIIPEHYICPITQELMSDPVIVSSGHTFERTAIMEWLDDGNTINPLTGQPLQNTEIKPNYALKEAIKEYRRKLADELFRITLDEANNAETLYYRDSVLFPKEISEQKQSDEKLFNEQDVNEYDGYISDDEQDVEHAHQSSKSNKKKKKRKYVKSKEDAQRNVPIIAFLGPNGTGKSTLLNLIVGEPVFVTMDELSEYDTLSKVVRFKVVSRSDREFILLDVEGLFPPDTDEYDANELITDAVLKIFLAVYSISSVIVWNDTDEHNPLLRELLHRADGMMRDINRDGTHFFGPYTIDDMEHFSETPNGSLLPEELRQFLMKKYKKLSKSYDSKMGAINIGHACDSHKPGFVVLRRDFQETFTTNIINDANYASSPSVTSNVDVSPSLFSLSGSNYHHHLIPINHEIGGNKSGNDSPSNTTDFSPSPKIKSMRNERYQIVNRRSSSHNQHHHTLNTNAYTASSGGSYGTASSGNETEHSYVKEHSSLSIVDENKEEKKQNMNDHDPNNSNVSDSSCIMDNILHNNILYGSVDEHKTKRKSNSKLFGDYVRKHDDFDWLRQFDLFCFVDGVVLQKLDENQSGDTHEMYHDDSLLSVLPKIEKWIYDWCRSAQNVVPIVRNNKDMLSVVAMINKYNKLSSIKYVEECMQTVSTRLPLYFYYDAQKRTLNELKLIAERFKWDKKNLMRWFSKHFNRLWYCIKDFPNAHEALLYQSLFYEYHMNMQSDSDLQAQMMPVVPTIILNVSHFYYQLSNKVDLYRNIVDKSAGFGQFAGAVSGLGSLSLMSVIHPLVGIVAVPFSIHLASSLGANSGAKVGDIVANSKARLIDGTERYDLGEFDENKNDENDDYAFEDKSYKGCHCDSS